MEQLHYTWAARGAEGTNRLQVAAISAGFRSPELVPLLPLIRKICRYEKPVGAGSAAPLSFGWFEHRLHRIAFSRVGLPQSRARRGNFAAHVVAAPSEQLSEADVASTLGSPFWWTGYPGEKEEEEAAQRRFELPPVEREEFLSGRSEPPREVPFAALVLARSLLTLPAGKRLAIRDEREELGPALRAVAWRLPAALAGISLSTYEGSSPGFAFDVVGTSRPMPRGLRCDLAAADTLGEGDRQLLTELFGTRPENAHLRAAIGTGAGASGVPTRREALWPTARQLFSIAAGDPMPGTATQALANPNAILYVCRAAAGPVAVAEAARAGGPAVLTALRSAWERLGAGTGEAVCTALAERFLAAGDLRGVARIAAAIPDRRSAERIVSPLLAAAVEDSGLVGGLPAEDAAFLVEELTRGRGPRTLGEPQKDLCVALLRRLPAPSLERELPPLLPALATPARVGPVEGLLSCFTRQVAARCLLTAMAPRAASQSARAVLSEFCDAYAAALTAQGAVPLALELLRRSDTRESTRAAELLRSATQGSSAAAAAAARDAASIVRPDLRAAVAERAMAGAIEAIRGTADVGAVWAALAWSRPGASQGELLRDLLGRIERSAEVPATIALAWVALCFLPDHAKLLRRGSLRDDEAEEIACRIAQRLPEGRLREWRSDAKRAGRGSNSWWKRLEARSRKPAKPSEPITP